MCAFEIKIPAVKQLGDAIPRKLRLKIKYNCFVKNAFRASNNNANNISLIIPPSFRLSRLLLYTPRYDNRRNLLRKYELATETQFITAIFRFRVFIVTLSVVGVLSARSTPGNPIPCVADGASISWDDHRRNLHRWPRRKGTRQEPGIHTSGMYVAFTCSRRERARTGKSLGRCVPRTCILRASSICAKIPRRRFQSRFRLAISAAWLNVCSIFLVTRKCH